MALQSSAMEAIVLASCTAMASSGDDQLFADGIANGLIALCMLAEVSTGTLSGSDTTPPGTFTGSGTGTPGCMVVSSCSSDIKTACDNMKEHPDQYDQKYLAAEIASAIDKVCTGTTIVLTYSGQTVTTTTPPQTVTSQDAATGKFSGSKGDIEDALNGIFDEMGELDDDHNQKKDYTDMCKTLADAVVDYLTGGSVSCQGTTHLAAVTGNGTIS